MSPRPPLCAPSLFQVKGLIIENTFTSVEDMVGQVWGAGRGLPGAVGACPERIWSGQVWRPAGGLLGACLLQGRPG